MSSPREMRWRPLEAPHPAMEAVRRLVAALLASAGAMLARLATSMALEPKAAPSDPCVEFHAEAGAPEGALYVDGRLVGWLSGVSRL
ncbi:MAG: hypothetical protein ABJA61_00880 [Caldimonas sp.]